MKSTIELSDLGDWQQFENLVASYFTTTEVGGCRITKRTSQSGVGPDGGLDILVEFRQNDAIGEHTRKWVIQCKFYNESVGPSSLASINIPSLVHSYKAVGFLLVVKSDVTAGVTNLFERLRDNCKFGYQYEIWSGHMFVERLYNAPPSILKQYFPEYSAFVEQVEMPNKLK